MAVSLDPVCGMQVVEENTSAENRSDYLNQTFYFCSTACRNKFDQQPADFVSRAEAARRARGGDEG